MECENAGAKEHRHNMELRTYLLANKDIGTLNLNASKYPARGE
jgi:hypothetical protein